jgi:hypothetical protein
LMSGEVQSMVRRTDEGVRVRNEGQGSINQRIHGAIVEFVAVQVTK